MTHFLSSESNPGGYRLEDVLSVIRKDIILRAGKIVDDGRPEAQQVLANNVRILGLLTDCISLAEDSTRLLEKSFGRQVPGLPRIGEP